MSISFLLIGSAIARAYLPLLLDWLVFLNSSIEITSGNSSLLILKCLSNLLIIVEEETLVSLAISLNVCLFVNLDRKSTRLNSSHVAISYAVFCLKKKKI